MVVLSLLLSLGLALKDSRQWPCEGHLGWEKGRRCELDFWHDAPHCLRPMVLFVLLLGIMLNSYISWNPFDTSF